MLQTAAQHFIAGMEGLGDSALSEEELFLACWHGVAYLDMAIFVAAIQHETAPGAVHAALGKLEE